MTTRKEEYAKTLAELKAYSAAVNTSYLTAIPRQPSPEGRCIVHNHVRPAHPIGMNGFRAWTQDSDPVRLEPCDCGWAPKLPEHYRVHHVGGDQS
jgi:hypothetical protein